MRTSIQKYFLLFLAFTMVATLQSYHRIEPFCLSYLNSPNGSMYPGDECCNEYLKLSREEQKDALFVLWDNRPSYDFDLCSTGHAK